MFVEPLESRMMLSVSPPAPGLSPEQVRHAYGFDQVTFRHKHKTVPADGRGTTMAIVTAYDAPTIKSDLEVFSQRFGLPTTDAYGEPTLTKVIHRSHPQADEGWALEAALDVQWAHAIAPKAHILLVEAASASKADLLTAVDYARSQSGVVAVSMSWGGHETPFDVYQDDYLTTPVGHVGAYGLRGGVTFVSASGDNGEPASWPSTSTHVVAVGGTTLSIGKGGRYRGESAWSGSGGGVSIYQGTYAPDVAYDADPESGFSVYDSYSGGWQSVGGTSAGCPQWAALFAIVAQGRAYAGRGSLDGPTEALSGIYAINKKSFHDVTTGANDNYAATPGYDLVTGRGSPVATRAIPGLVAWDPETMSAARVTRSVSAATAPAIVSPMFSTTLVWKRDERLFGSSEVS
jgi:subtilase family serine protease